jgi:hypothetical protein
LIGGSSLSSTLRLFQDAPPVQVVSIRWRWQPFTSFSQQFAFASSDSKTLQTGSVCAGDTIEDPIGAIFDEVYDGTFNYVVWNDQFYQDPKINGCGDSCSAPWGHSKGMIAWNDAGDGLVMQVTTPDWPGAGSKHSPRQDEGNTLGCTKKDNDIKVSQHFFALNLSKIALDWMLQEAKAAGLLIDDNKEKEVLGVSGGNFVVPDPQASAHESLKGPWSIAKFIWKKHWGVNVGGTIHPFEASG